MEISHQFSYTFQPGRNQWAKVNIELNGLNTDLPIEEQLAVVDGVLEVSWPYLRAKVDAEVEEVYNLAKEEE